MNHVCDQVDRLHRDNEELSARLRNLEYSSGSGSLRRSTVVGTINSIRKDHGSSYAQSTTSTSSHEKSLGSKRSGFVSLPGSVGSTVDQKEPVHRSAFEEQLHRSRVYRHAEANHSESSFTDDGCSTLALSICSSLTLGEVSNISVFAIPIFADELSNALAYDFTRPNECAMISIPDRTYDNQSALITFSLTDGDVTEIRIFRNSKQSRTGETKCSRNETFSGCGHFSGQRRDGSGKNCQVRSKNNRPHVCGYVHVPALSS